MTSVQLVFYIATVYVYNAESGWLRFVERRAARDPDDFRRGVYAERADDEVYIGPVGESKRQAL